MTALLPENQATTTTTTSINIDMIKIDFLNRLECKRVIFQKSLNSFKINLEMSWRNLCVRAFNTLLTGNLISNLPFYTIEALLFFFLLFYVFDMLIKTVCIIMH